MRLQYPGNVIKGITDKCRNWKFQIKTFDLWKAYAGKIITDVLLKIDSDRVGSF